MTSSLTFKKKAVEYKQVKRAGGAEELEFLQAFFKEWFSLFQEDPSLTGLDLEGAQWAHKKVCVSPTVSA